MRVSLVKSMSTPTSKHSAMTKFAPRSPLRSSQSARTAPARSWWLEGEARHLREDQRVVSAHRRQSFGLARISATPFQASRIVTTWEALGDGSASVIFQARSTNRISLDRSCFVCNVSTAGGKLTTTRSSTALCSQCRKPCRPFKNPGRTAPGDRSTSTVGHTGWSHSRF